MDQSNEIFLTIVSLLLILVILWFSYTIINIFITMYRCKKVDHSLGFCFNTLGKVFYLGLTIAYVLCLVGGIAAFMSVLYGYMLSSIVLVVKKNMMVGRMMIDYRKLKKVNYSYENKMSFVYAQHEYNFSTRFVDLTELRKRISR